jgi:hypothetical protein
VIIIIFMLGEDGEDKQLPILNNFNTIYYIFK